MLLTGLMLAVCAWATSVAQDATALTELAPTGKLRVGIGVAPAASAFWATRDPGTGAPRGVTVDLGTELAKQLGVPMELISYANSQAPLSRQPTPPVQSDAVSTVPVSTER